jgi:hypothetical protein
MSNGGSGRAEIPAVERRAMRADASGITRLVKGTLVEPSFQKARQPRSQEAPAVHVLVLDHAALFWLTA